MQPCCQLVSQQAVDDPMPLHQALAVEGRRDDLNSEVGLCVSSARGVAGVASVLVRLVDYGKRGGAETGLEFAAREWRRGGERRRRWVKRANWVRCSAGTGPFAAYVAMLFSTCPACFAAVDISAAKALARGGWLDLIIKGQDYVM